MFPSIAAKIFIRVVIKGGPSGLLHQCGDNRPVVYLLLCKDDSAIDSVVYSINVVHSVTCMFFKFEGPKYQSWNHKVWNFHSKKHQVQLPVLYAGQLLLKVPPRPLTWL